MIMNSLIDRDSLDIELNDLINKKSIYEDRLIENEDERRAELSEIVIDEDENDPEILNENSDTFSSVNDYYDEQAADIKQQISEIDEQISRLSDLYNS